MLAVAWWQTALAFVFAVLAILLMLVILLQRGKGVGLAGAFGGAGGGTAFGAKTGDVLTWVTVTVAGVLLLFTVILNYCFVPASAGLDQPAKLGATPAAGEGEAAPPASAPAGSSLPAALPFGEELA